MSEAKRVFMAAYAFKTDDTSGHGRVQLTMIGDRVSAGLTRDVWDDAEKWIKENVAEVTGAHVILLALTEIVAP